MVRTGLSMPLLVSPMSLLPVCAPKPCLSLCFCVLSVPGLIVPYVVFHVCPCPLSPVPLWYLHHFLRVTVSHSEPLSLGVPMHLQVSCASVHSLPCSLWIPGFALYLQGPVTSPRVARPCLRSWLRGGLSLSCDGVLYRALLTPGLLLVSTEHCVPESD